MSEEDQNQGAKSNHLISDGNRQESTLSRVLLVILPLRVKGLGRKLGELQQRLTSEAEYADVRLSWLSRLWQGKRFLCESRYTQYSIRI